MKQGEIWLINLDPTVGAEIKHHDQEYYRLKMNKLHKKQVIAGLKDAKEGKVMDSATFWKKLNNQSLSPVKNQSNHSTSRPK